MYKQSRYNYFVPYCNKILYFNALSKISFLMTTQEHEKLQEQFADPISFEFGIPSVFNKFAEWGFFVKEVYEISSTQAELYEAMKRYYASIQAVWNQFYLLRKITLYDFTQQCELTESLLKR